MSNKLKDYFRLCQDLAERQYDALGEFVWSPGESELALKIKSKQTEPKSQIYDISDLKKAEIKDIIANNKNIKINNFIAKLTNYRYENKICVKISLTLYEFKSYKGIKNLISQKVNPIKDSRFKNEKWASYFDSFECAEDVDIDELVNILKYIQFIGKHGHFI